MKKLYQAPRFRKYNLGRSDKQELRKLHHKKWRKARNRDNARTASERRGLSRRTRQQYHDFERVRVPDVFSLTGNTGEVVKLINRLETLLKKRTKVFVLLDQVTTIDYGAIVVLLSVLVNFKARNIGFNGNFPRDAMARDIVEKSGFLDCLYRPFSILDRYEISSRAEGGIFTHAWKKVDAKLGSNIIESAARTIWGEPKRCPGVQRTLLELMQNTNNHADLRGGGYKHWWLSVFHDKKRRKVAFAFVDFGVGVFNSLQSKGAGSKWYGWAAKLVRKRPYKDNAELLQLILEGHLHQTVTQKHYRGKGLPGVAEVLRRKEITNLVIITNNVLCEPESGKYVVLDRSFNGTYISWELGEDNGHFDFR